MRDHVTLVNPEPGGRNLPATSTDTRVTVRDADRRPVWRQPVSVAYLPLGLATFIILAFMMAMWTFLAATG